uniref:Uncharacterized protein n=1 Tax=Arcella intermedia TaxID=1963864 RepID=A0A6B2L2L9_9EUKA
MKPPLGVKPDDYFRFIPSFIGTLLPGGQLSWSTNCFTQNKATLDVNQANSTATLSIISTGKTSLLCDSGYLSAYVAGMSLDYFEEEGLHQIQFSGPWLEEEYYDIAHNGIRIFNFTEGITMTTESIFETVLLFFGGLVGANVPEWTAEDNLAFLKDHMNLVMPERPVNRIDIPKSEIKSGDLLGVIRLDGLDPMLSWGMGSRTGHTCIAMWDNNNQLFVAESTVNSAYWPTNGIQLTPWDTWMDQAQNASYNVLHIPLDPLVASKFNASAAWEFFSTVEGLPYGFHNLFTGWIDTPEDNYPPPLTSQLVQLLAPFAEWLLQKEIGIGQTYDFLTQGLNYRLGTKGLTLNQAYMEASKRGISFTELVTMPEQDSWTFVDSNGVVGPSMVCDVFVSSMWKVGGIFGDLKDSIQVTEFTDWDAYTLKIFDANYKRPAACVAADPDIPFCQILGKYRMNLPDYNTYTPFPNMRQKCPTLPPNYIKPPNC